MEILKKYKEKVCGIFDSTSEGLSYHWATKNENDKLDVLQQELIEFQSARFPLGGKKYWN